MPDRGQRFNPEESEPGRDLRLGRLTTLMPRKDRERVYGREALFDALRQDWRVLHDCGLEIRDGGIFTKLNSQLDEQILGIVAREVLDHPLKDRDSPVLPIPFTLDQFRVFVEFYGLAALWQLLEKDDVVPDSKGIAELEETSKPGAELVRAMLDMAPIDYGAGSGARATSRSAAQEAAILEFLSSHGYKPTALPKATREGGAKAEAFEYVQGKRRDIFQSRRVFDKAWERLRRDGRVSNP